MMPSSTEGGTEDGTVSSTTSIQKPPPAASAASQSSNQDSVSSQMSEARPSLGLANQISVDQGTPEPVPPVATNKRKEDTIADLEQNLQSIMGTTGKES